MLFLIALAPQAFGSPPNIVPVPEEPAALDNVLGAGVVLLGVVLTRRGIGRLLRNLWTSTAFEAVDDEHGAIPMASGLRERYVTS